MNRKLLADILLLLILTLTFGGIAILIFLLSVINHPTEEQMTFHYWKDYLDVFAEFLTAFGTIAVAILAVWGDPIRHWLGGPRLKLTLVRKEGLLAKHAKKVPAPDNKSYVDQVNVVRHYHLKIENRREWIPANKVRVCIQRIARQQHPSQDFTETQIPWPVYLRYSFSETDAHKNLEPNVGAPLSADFLCIGEKGGEPKLMLVMKPDSLTDLLEKDIPYKFQIQAMGENAVSNKLYLRVTWDGKWHEGDTEMAGHLTITQLAHW